ncbi:GPI transamidase subunit PIG-U [Spinellus fusiger]|nr:GPI transamidase subunit PIG-U [Spinellus fusiger]
MNKVGHGCVYVGAIVLRLLLLSLPQVTHVLGQRVELVTPVTSYKRLTEGVFLYESSVPPYEGGLVHQPPLLLALFSLLHSLPQGVVALVYAGLDGVVAYGLAKICAKKQSTDPCTATVSPLKVATLYLFHPFSILSCVSRSTLIFTNASIVLALVWASHGHSIAAMFWVAMASYLSFYPLMLIAPLALYSTRPWLSVAACVGWLGLLLGLSRLWMGSWDFIHAVYGVVVFLSDLTPNVGMFWYFFIEIFDQFRSFFMVVFQLHSFIFVAPLCIKQRHMPIFVITILCGIMSVFKSYPSVGDCALFFGLVPIHDEIIQYCRYGFLVSNLFLYASVLSPIFWYLWIYAGSGNANFFYAITLVYNLGQILLLIDLVYSALRRDYDVAHPEHIGKQVVQR